MKRRSSERAAELPDVGQLRKALLVSAACGLLIGLCVAGTGCTRSDETPEAGGTRQGAQSAPGSRAAAETSGGLAIEFRSEPDPPKSGDNNFAVTVREADGTPVTDAGVTVVFTMPAMPSMNMPAMRSAATLAHEASGRYRGPGQLAMDGTWNVTVTVSRAGQEIGSQRFSVVAN